MRRTTLLVLVVLLASCAFHEVPYVMHDGSTPIGNTAVFASLDERSVKSNDSRIRTVDGKPTPCAQVGCPYWVRVTPGTHVFSVRYSSTFKWNLNESSFSYVDLPIEMRDMKPRHVYVVRYREADRRVQFDVEDLGANPDFGISLGLDGKRYRVGF